MSDLLNRQFLQEKGINQKYIARIWQDLARSKLCVNTLGSDDLCISPKSKHNQPLEVKFEKLHTCGAYFVCNRTCLKASGIKKFLAKICFVMA